MNYSQKFEQIGDGSEQEGFNPPALRKTIADRVIEYEQKEAGISKAFAAFERAVQDVKNGSTIMGTYGGSVFSCDPYLYERDMRKSLLKSAWKNAYEFLNIAKVASAKDRKQIELALENPPEFTHGNVVASFEDYILSPRHHILKGLAECFCDLDPAYKSHSNVKIGVDRLPKRIIIECVGGYGSWGRERVQDTMNSLLAYRGEPRLDYTQFEAIMKEASRYGEADFCGGIIKRFKNGNAHLVFNKWGLLDINRALAEFYGEVLPDAPSETEAKRPSTEVARDLQFYPTPRKAIQAMCSKLYFKGETTHSVLEPSCGDGAILDYLRELETDPNARSWEIPTFQATGIEYDAGRASTARSKGHNVMQANFLEIPPEARFDFVLMNPPFYGKHYKKHLDHAVKFLRSGGVLACILPASAHYDHGNSIGTWHDLPVGSFASSGTNIPTGFCVYHK